MRAAMALSTLLKGAQRAFPFTPRAIQCVTTTPSHRVVSARSAYPTLFALRASSSPSPSPILHPVSVSLRASSNVPVAPVHPINPDPPSNHSRQRTPSASRSHAPLESSSSSTPLASPWALSPYGYPHRSDRPPRHLLQFNDLDLSPGPSSTPFIKVASDFISSALVLLSFLPHLLLSSTYMMPMAAAAYPFSSSSSDISTPRSASPSSSRGRTSITTASNRMSISSTRRISNLNPMSTVDTQALEEAMKAAQLDQLRGYRKDTYGVVKQSRENVYVTDAAKQEAVGQQILREPVFNKGKSNHLNKLYIKCPVLRGRGFFTAHYLEFLPNSLLPRHSPGLSPRSQLIRLHSRQYVPDADE